MTRWIFCVFLLILTTLYARAEMTMVQGTVKQPDGTPCLNMLVTITVDGTTSTVTTDRNGHFGKSVPVGKATVTVEGVTKTIILSPDDWDSNTVDLTLGNGRIVQTIFGMDGKPLPGAEVTITYIWEDTLYYKQAKADAAGTITWDGLPPVKAIVWGPKVPAGVLPIGATTVTTPLPAPVPAAKDYLISFTLPTPPGTPTPIYWMVDPPGQNGPVTTMDSQVRYTDGKIHSNYNQYHFIGGTRFSLAVLSLSDPIKYAVLDDVYAPYDDGKDIINRMSLEWKDGMTVTLRLGSADGKVVPALSGLHVLPDNLQGVPELLSREVKRLKDVLALRAKGPGTWTLSLLTPGTYRLEGDLFTGASALPFSVAAGQQVVNIKLPSPLITAPGGTEVTYLQRTEPCTQRKVTIDPNTPVGALFGPADAILACWYRPSPAKLIWQTADMAAPQESTLRTVFLRFLGPNGEPVVPQTENRDIALSALLPGSRADRFSTAPGNAPVSVGDYEMPATTEAQTYPDGEVRAQVTAWSGKYLLTGFDDMNWSTPVEIPVAGANEIAIIVDADTSGASAQPGKRSVSVTIPATAEQLRAGANVAIVTTDIPGDRTVLAKRLFQAPQATRQLTLDARAKTFMLHWPGVGVVKDVVIPEPNQTVDIPAWAPGIRMTGKVLAADGTPVANSMLSIGNGSRVQDSNIRVTTDADGRFSVNGIQPGPIMIVLTNSPKPGGWTVVVPQEGPADFTLQAGRRSGIEEITIDSVTQAWWIPATGAARQLPVIGRGVYTYDPIEGDGAIWLLAGNTAPRLLPYNPATGVQKQREIDRAIGARTDSWMPDGPSLGFTLPLAPRTGTKTTVTLTGRGALGNCQVVLDNYPGTVSSLLGKVLYQISSVPPGAYDLCVDTGAGIISAPVTVAAQGGFVELSYPPAPAK